MNWKNLIIPGVILFFVIIGILAWFADNPVCVLILEILGGLFLFCVFCVLPGVALANIFRYKRVYLFIGGTFLFWCLVILILDFLRPEWGWAYVRWADKYLRDLVSLIY